MAIVMGVLTITLTIGGKMKLKLNIAILMHMSFLPIKCSHILLPYFNRIRDHWHRQYNGRKTVFCVLELAVITSFFKLYFSHTNTNLLLVFVYTHIGVRCCCGWYTGGSQPVTQGRIANRCDYRRLVTSTENLANCRDANEGHGLGCKL